MFSVTMVGVCITYRSYQCNFTSSDYHIRHGSWKSFLSFEPHNFNQVLTSLPLLLSCYICHFNVLTVHNEFRTPTKSKIQKTIQLDISYIPGNSSLSKVLVTYSLNFSTLVNAIDSSFLPESFVDRSLLGSKWRRGNLIVILSGKGPLSGVGVPTGIAPTPVKMLEFGPSTNEWD